MSGTAALLTGGRARRLGGLAKGWLEVDGEPIVARLVRLLAAEVGPVRLVANDPSPYAALGLPAVADVFPDRGAPAGVHAALATAPPGWVFVAACDLPFLDAATVRALAAARRPGDRAVLARAGGRLQPLAGFWHTDARADFERLLAEGAPALGRLAEAVGAREVPLDDARPFTNVNTPEDVAAVRASRSG